MNDNTRPANGPFKGQRHRIALQQADKRVATALHIQAEGMLQEAGLDPDDARDCRLLAEDIFAVATEIDASADAVGCAQAARELTRRIGGLLNLGSYIATLRAGAEKTGKPPSATDTFYANPTPINAIRVAIADHQAFNEGPGIQEYTSQLHAAIELLGECATLLFQADKYVEDFARLSGPNGNGNAAHLRRAIRIAIAKAAP